MPLREECEKAFADLFKIVDRDNNGEISLFEYLVAQKKIHSMTVPKKRWMFKDMDKDEDGKISTREWHEAMHAIADEVGEEDLLACIVRAWPDHPLALSAEHDECGNPIFFAILRAMWDEDT